MLVHSIVLGYAAAVGFVAASIVSSLHQLVTNRPASFRLWPGSFLTTLSWVGFATVAGPAILVRNSVRGYRIQNRPLGYVLAGCGIAALWSFFCGIVLLEVLLAVG